MHQIYRIFSVGPLRSYQRTETSPK